MVFANCKITKLHTATIINQSKILSEYFTLSELCQAKHTLVYDTWTKSIFLLDWPFYYNALQTCIYTRTSCSIWHILELFILSMSFRGLWLSLQCLVWPRMPLRWPSKIGINAGAVFKQFKQEFLPLPLMPLQ